MIFDNLKNCELYYANHPKFKDGFDFIKKAISENLPTGKYELDGKNLYASISEYDSKEPEMAKNEGHRNYIDIRFVISGLEKIEVKEIANCTLKSEYNDVKDVEFYEDATFPTTLILSDGDFAILFPCDIHKPGVKVNEESVPIKKVVVKVKVK